MSPSERELTLSCARVVAMTMQLYLACLLATAHGAFLGGLRAPTRTPVRSSVRSFVSMDVSKGVVR